MRATFIGKLTTFGTVNPVLIHSHHQTSSIWKQPTYIFPHTGYMWIILSAVYSGHKKGKSSGLPVHVTLATVHQIIYGRLLLLMEITSCLWNALLWPGCGLDGTLWTDCTGAVDYPSSSLLFYWNWVCIIHYNAEYITVSMLRKGKGRTPRSSTERSVFFKARKKVYTERLNKERL